MRSIVEALVGRSFRRGPDQSSAEYWQNYYETRPAGWITPHGAYHPLSTLPEGKRTHPRWIEHNKEIVRQHGHLVVNGPHADENTHDKMMRGGWVQKENKDRYRVWNDHPDTLKTVRDHVKQHHPGLREVKVELSNPAAGGRSFSSPVYESEGERVAALTTWLIEIAMSDGGELDAAGVRVGA